LLIIRLCPKQPAEQIPHRCNEVADRNDDGDESDDSHNEAENDLVHDVVIIRHQILSEVLHLNVTPQLSFIEVLDHVVQDFWLNKLKDAMELEQFEELEEGLGALVLGEVSERDHSEEINDESGPRVMSPKVGDYLR